MHVAQRASGVRDAFAEFETVFSLHLAVEASVLGADEDVDEFGDGYSGIRDHGRREILLGDGRHVDFLHWALFVAHPSAVFLRRHVAICTMVPTGPMGNSNMIVDLNDSERAEMQERSSDVTVLVSILKGMGAEHVSRESAFKAWSEHSESSAASWLIIPNQFEGLQEVASAHDRIVDRWKDEMHDYVVGGRRQEKDAEPDVPEAPVRFRPEDPKSVERVARLREIGFDPPSDVVRGEAAIDRMNHISGRLSNVQYMANAIDAADGIPEADRARGVAGGARQFAHLMESDRRDGGDMGRCYVALRRAQRAGDHDRVRVGLVMLVAADRDEIGHSDVLRALGDDGIPKSMRLEVQAGHAPRLVTGAKGPARNEAPDAVAAAAARGGAER